MVLALSELSVAADLDDSGVDSASFGRVGRGVDETDPVFRGRERGTKTCLTCVAVTFLAKKVGCFVIVCSVGAGVLALLLLVLLLVVPKILFSVSGSSGRGIEERIRVAHGDRCCVAGGVSIP